MPTIEEFKAIDGSLKKVVLASKLTTPDMIYHGIYGVKGWYPQLKDQLDKFSSQVQTPEDKIKYANMLFAYAKEANARKGNIYGVSASRDYFNADLLFEKGFQVLSDLNTPESNKLKAEILIEQAYFYKSFANDGSGYLDDIQKTPQQIREMYASAFEISNNINDPTLKSKAEVGLAAYPVDRREKAEMLQASLREFITIASHAADPHLMVDLASVKIIENKNGGYDLYIDPNSVRGASLLVESMLSTAKVDNEEIEILGLEKGVDFSVEEHSIRTNKFILHESAFDKCFARINRSLQNQAGISQQLNEVASSMPEPSLPQTPQPEVVPTPPLPEAKTPLPEVKIPPEVKTPLPEVGAPLEPPLRPLPIPRSPLPERPLPDYSDLERALDDLESVETPTPTPKEPTPPSTPPHSPSIDPVSVVPPAPPLSIEPTSIPTPTTSSLETKEVKVSPVPPLKEPYKNGRTQPINSEILSKINISNWEKGTAEEKNVTRFVQSSSKSNYIDVNQSKHQISSNDTSPETFKAMISIFQEIYGKDAIPTFTLDKNTPENRENCQKALQEASYSPDQVAKIMKTIASAPAPTPAAPAEPAPSKPRPGM